MFSFCPECGGSIDQEQVEGRTLVCKHCGKRIGSVSPAPKPQVVDAAAQLIQAGTAARCPLCQQLVDVRTRESTRSFVPHYAAAPQRKLCPNSGKPVPLNPAAAAPPTPPASAPIPVGKGPGGKDLSAFMTSEQIRVGACARDGSPTIEELTLQYLDKADRVRIQIEALRDILGPTFRMLAYPAALNRTHLAVWSSPSACVVARKHERGGYQAMSDAELHQVVEDLKQHRQMFFSR